MKPTRARLSLILGILPLFAACNSAEFSAGTPASPVAQQVTEEEIVFGVDKVFHIGDGKYPDSSCKEKLDTYSLNGIRYFFEFEVINPQTTLDISINKVCGVDYLLTNGTRLVNSSGYIYQVQPVFPTTSQITYQSLTLEPGKYAIIVESGRNYTEVRTGDHDNFLVGNINVKATKKIVGGTVRTE